MMFWICSVRNLLFSAKNSPFCCLAPCTTNRALSACTQLVPRGMLLYRQSGFSVLSGANC